MFSRFKKPDAEPNRPTLTPVGSGSPEKRAAVPASGSHAKPDAPKLPLRPVAVVKNPAEVAAADKERKRKERMSELKVQLHKRLLDNLNLAALETASEQSLKSEIAAISAEALDELSVALNSNDRITLNQELYDEVMGLGPLEPLLKDETVNDILVNGPNRIFVERNG